MQRKMFLGKIHRATITQADLHYEGSISIDQDLLKAAGILPYELVQVYNINNGERFETYALEAESGSGCIGLNGAAARKGVPGDLVIIATYGWCDEAEARKVQPKVVQVDRRNRIIRNSPNLKAAG